MHEYICTFLTRSGLSRFFCASLLILKTSKAVSIDAVAFTDTVILSMYVPLELHSDIDNMVDVDRPYVFILISSVLTWARSKPVDPVMSL